MDGPGNGQVTETVPANEVEISETLPPNEVEISETVPENKLQVDTSQTVQEKTPDFSQLRILP